MPMQRVANSAFEKNAQHYTLVRVVNNDTQRYGFAVSEDGVDVFIPGPLIRRLNLSELDEGAGFRALTRPSPPDIIHQAAPGRPTAQLTVIPPVVLDDQNPTFVAAIPANRMHEILTPDDQIAQMDDELDEMLTHFESVTAILPALDQALDLVRKAATLSGKMLTGSFGDIIKIQRELSDALEKAEGLTVAAHNLLTAEIEWRDETYPDEDAAAPASKSA